MKNNITKEMVEKINEFFKEKGCDLRYVITMRDSYSINYKLLVVNEFIDNKYPSELNLTENGEKKIKKFIKDNFGDVNTGYINQINNIVVFKQL